MMISEQEILNASILIVDDQESNVQLLEQMLREAGYLNITSTMDPHAVCALHRDNHYDLILLDLQMPGMDGFEVLKALRDPAPHIVFSTAHDEYAIRAFEVQAVDYLLKPYDRARVAAAV